MGKTTKLKKNNNTLAAKVNLREESDKALAKLALTPGIRHAAVASAYASPIFGDSHARSIVQDVEVLADSLAKAQSGDKGFASQMLAAQAIVLDAMFTELARRAGTNMGEYLDAADRYLRLALKAQTNCRATLEAFAKLHQPREQTVKHVHVNEGGKAVVADQILQYRGEGQNGKPNEQSHATDPARQSAAMLGHDTQGNGVPIPSSEGKKKVSHARRDQSRCTQR